MRVQLFAWAGVTSAQPSSENGAFTAAAKHLPAIPYRHFGRELCGLAALLRKYGVALVSADTVDWPLLMDVTSDFIYCRLHGSEQLYANGHDAPAIAAWPKRVRRDGFVYFDNDAKVRAPLDALALVTAVEKRLASAGGTARARTR
jgi:uncharacterized protein YecE (DUF72 family)